MPKFSIFNEGIFNGSIFLILCSCLAFSSDVYKRIDYENAKEPTWCTALTERVVAPFRIDSPLKQVKGF